MASKSAQNQRLKLRVKPAAETAIRGGHPWVYGDAVLQQSRAGQPGEIAIVYDRKDRFLALGLFDPESPIRFRVLHMGNPSPINNSWWIQRLEVALSRRKSLFDRPVTDGFRLIYGESDGWPGMVLDKYATTLVLKLYTGAWFVRLPLIVNLLTKRLEPARLVLRLSRNIQEAATTHGGWTDGQTLFGTAPTGPVVFQENGLRFEAEVIRGQKTGFFLDQRENRQRLRKLASGKRVLNTFSFSGGFSLYAADGRAQSVTDVDISRHALESGARNFALNADNPQIRDCQRRAVKADVFDWLKTERERYDVVVIDPPSLARREPERAGAIESYYRLAGLGIARLAPDGVLAACSCSAHVSTQEFLDAVRRALQHSGRSWEEIEVCGHPADHHATFKEAEYLKAIWLRVK